MRHQLLLYKLLFALLLINKPTFVQAESLDSLKLVLISSKEKTSLSNKISKTYWNSNLDSAEKYAIMALNYANLNNNELENWNAIRSLGIISEIRGDYNKSISFHLSNIKNATDLNQQDLRAMAFMDLGNTYNESSIYDSALIQYYKALRIYGELNNGKNVLHCKGNIALVYQRKENFGKTINLLLELKNEYCEINNLSGLRNTYLTLGNVYLQNNEYVKSKNNYFKALSLIRKNDLYSENKIIGNIAMAYGKLKNYDSSEFYFLRQESQYLNTPNIVGLNSCYINYAQLSLLKNDSIKAESIIMKVNEKYLKSKHDLIHYYLVYGKIKFYLKEYEDADVLFFKGMQESKKYNVDRWLIELSNYLSKTNSSLNKYENACFYYNFYDSLKSIKYKDMISRSIAKAEKKEAISIEKIIKKSKIDKLKTIVILLILALILFSVIMNKILIKNKKIKNSNKMLNQNSIVFENIKSIIDLNFENKFKSTGLKKDAEININTIAYALYVAPKQPCKIFLKDGAFVNYTKSLSMLFKELNSISPILFGQLNDICIVSYDMIQKNEPESKFVLSRMEVDKIKFTGKEYIFNDRIVEATRGELLNAFEKGFKRFNLLKENYTFK